MFLCRHLLSLGCLFLFGCSVDSPIVADGKTRVFPFRGNTPVPVSNRWVDVAAVDLGLVKNREDVHCLWTLSLRIKSSKVESVSVTDVTGDRQELIVSKRVPEPDLHGMWQFTSDTFAFDDPSADFLKDFAADIFVYRFDLLLSDGSSEPLYQPAVILGEFDSALAEILP